MPPSFHLLALSPNSAWVEWQDDQNGVNGGLPLLTLLCVLPSLGNVSENTDDKFGDLIFLMLLRPVVSR